MNSTLIRSLVFLACCIATPVVANAASYTTSTSGNWSNPVTWGNSGPPGPGDSATVVSNVILDVPVTVASVTLNAGSIGGSANALDVTSSFAWTGGTIGGGGGSLNVLATASLAISGATAKTLANFTINNVSSTSTWAAGSSGITFSQTAVFNNSGTLTIQNDAALSHNGDGGSPAFNNSGTLRKQTATGTSIIGSPGIALPFNNTGGTIDVQTGVLRFEGAFNVTTAAGALAAGTLELAGGGTSTADWSVAGGATMKFLAFPHTIGGTWSGASGSTYWINGATANVVVSGALSGDTITLSSGTLRGAGTITPGTAFNWSGGTIGGAAGANGLLNVGAAATLSISGATAKTLSNFTINNASSTSTWAAGSSGVTFSQTAVFNNSGTLTIQNDAALSHNGDGGSPAFNNSGTLRKQTATGTSIIGSPGIALPFNNTGGTIDVQTGVLRFEGAFNVTAAAGALAAGTLELAGGGTSTADWSVAGGATMKFLAFPYTIGGTWSGASGSTYWINGATANVEVSGALSGDTITLSIGTLRGAGTITPGTAFNWSGGTIGGAAGANGLLNVGAAATLSISGATAKTLSNFTINNASSTSTWAAGSSGVTFSQTAVFNNSGTLTIQNDAALSHNGDGGSPAFNNSGTLRKQTATGTSIIGSPGIALPFNNTGGTVDVETGAVSLLGAYTQTAASHLKFGIAGTAPATQFGNLSVAGSMDLSNATLTAYPLGGFSPGPADSFQVVNAGTRVGSFATVNANFGGGVVLQPVYNPTNVTLAYGNAGTLELSSATYSAGEAAPTVTITVNRSGGSLGAVSVSYATADVSAVSGSDYTGPAPAA